MAKHTHTYMSTLTYTWNECIHITYSTMYVSTRPKPLILYMQFLVHAFYILILNAQGFVSIYLLLSRLLCRSLGALLDISTLGLGILRYRVHQGDIKTTDKPATQDRLGVRETPRPPRSYRSVIQFDSVSVSALTVFDLCLLCPLL